MKIKDIVKGHFVEFSFYRQGNFYYEVTCFTGDDNEKATVFQFSVPLDDIGTATLLPRDKAITFMRWIRKAQEEGSLILLKQY